ncbi:hypothetical protein BC834DRAFT_971831 [Gloeopeniophorella convolvens]|nr:hypothetical protein BC834DRAFT_971831 [Gloeopeniophorella convolvens]
MLPPYAQYVTIPPPPPASCLHSDEHLTGATDLDKLYPSEVAEAVALMFGGTLMCYNAAATQAVTCARSVDLGSVKLSGRELHAAGERVTKAQRAPAVKGRPPGARRAAD